MDNRLILTVSQLNTYVKSLIDSDKNLSDVFVCGEISNLKNHYASGHIYFTLKDGNSLVPAVMFKWNASQLQFELSDGMRVICHARASVYEKDSKFQLYVSSVRSVGIGDLYMKFEQLKNKLSKQGIFDDDIKKLLPPFPKRAAVLTSDTGSVIHDIINVSSRRYPLCEIVLCPVTVQGENASKTISDMLKRADESGKFDVIIIARGGGSFEDLMPFNDENLAYAIYNCSTPVVSAVGHETDFTICDFAADLRAPTPSSAAELVFPDVRELQAYFNQTSYTLLSLLKNKISEYRVSLNAVSNRPVLKDPELMIKKRKEQFNLLRDSLYSSFKSAVGEKRNTVSNISGRLNAVSPLAVLSRGYSIAEKDGNIIKSSKDLNKNDLINIKFYSGKASCKIIETEK